MVKFSFPTLIHFGAGVRKEVPAFLTSNKVSRPLVVTDRGVAQQKFFNDYVADLKKSVSA